MLEWSSAFVTGNKEVTV